MKFNIELTELEVRLLMAGLSAERRRIRKEAVNDLISVNDAQEQIKENRTLDDRLFALK